MNSAMAFLLVALLAAALGSAAIWAIQHRPRRNEVPDFQSQLRAIAPRPSTAEQPTGITRVDRATEGDRPAAEER